MVDPKSNHLQEEERAIQQKLPNKIMRMMRTEILEKTSEWDKTTMIIQLTIRMDKSLS